MSEMEIIRDNQKRIAHGQEIVLMIKTWRAWRVQYVSQKSYSELIIIATGDITKV